MSHSIYTSTITPFGLAFISKQGSCHMHHSVINTSGVLRIRDTTPFKGEFCDKDHVAPKPLFCDKGHVDPKENSRHKLCKLHWSLSFQYSRWLIGFFHRVFAFVRVEPNILSSHFVRVVPSWFCQTVTIPFVCVNRGLLLQDLSVSIANGLALVRVSSPAARLHGNSILRKDVSLDGLEAWHQKNLINSSCRKLGS